MKKLKAAEKVKDKTLSAETVEKLLNELFSLNEED